VLYREVIAVYCDKRSGQKRALLLPLQYLVRSMNGAEILRGVLCVEVTNGRTVEVRKTENRIAKHDC
jgi:hypothetical protein